MKKLFLTLSLLIMAMFAMAVPAKRGVWRTLALNDGTEVRAQLVGDEFAHFWIAEDGRTYRETEDSELFERVDKSTIVERAKARRQQVDKRRAMRLASRRAGTVGQYLGQKKALILLVEFSNKSFKTNNDSALFVRMANEKGFSDGRFKGSMSDYFLHQSFEQFELDFDIVGPIKMDKTYSYYGSNDSGGNDKHPGEMVGKAVKEAKAIVSDWNQYDWNEDGEVDQVYVIYAGNGEADGGASNTIWPHAYALSSASYYGDGTGPVTVAPGLVVDTYACGPELSGTGSVNGIGTMCHEFSHCLGYPDFYDTDYSGGQGMGEWDLMDSGSYNDDGFQPAGYTSYERWVAGWAEPILLEDENVTVEDMPDLQSSAQSYIIYNKGNRDEFFLLENRQRTGWDASLPGTGLLILHVDYDENVWIANEPNDNPSHQRMTWIPADNQYQYYTYMGTRYYTTDGMSTDTYPYDSNNCFNKTSTPAAKFYNKNTDGTYYLDTSVEDIAVNAIGMVSFRYVAKEGGDPDIDPVTNDYWFYESFNKCNGTGGNDNQWSGRIANTDLVPDNEGWVSTDDKAFSANKCAKFGSIVVPGSATTPAFHMEGESVMTFKAGSWVGDYDGTVLTLSVSEGTVNPSQFTMKHGAFQNYSATVTATDEVTLTFTTDEGRFFLDEVLVPRDMTTGINDTNLEPITNHRYFNLNGQEVKHPGKGLYILNGRKVMIK